MLPAFEEGVGVVHEAQWLEEVANVRIHRATRKKPIDLFKAEKPAMGPLPQMPYDVSVAHPVDAGLEDHADRTGALFAVCDGLLLLG